MDLQEYVNQFDSMTCIMSVEKKPDGSYGAMRIEVGNKAYMATFEQNHDNLIDMPFGKKFIPGLEYTAYLPKDLNFEHFIYSSAVLKKSMHAYIHPERFNVWFNIFSSFLPKLARTSSQAFLQKQLQPSSRHASSSAAPRISLRQWTKSSPTSASFANRIIAASCSRTSRTTLVRY